MTPKEIKDAFWQILTDRTTYEWMLLPQAGERPKPPYGAISLLTSPNSPHTLEEERFEVEGTKLFVRTGGQRDVSVTLNFYGPDACGVLASVRDMMKTVNFRYDFASVTRQKGFELALVDVATIQDLSALLQSDYEERAAMDLIFRGSDCVREEIVSIDEIKDLKATYENVAGETVLEETKTIDLN